MKLTDQLVWITGASSGIGAQLAREFAKNGSRLILSARSEDKLEALKDELSNGYGAEILCLPLDVSNSASIKSTLEFINNRFPAIDILVNNAGISQRSLIADTPLEVDRQLFEINFFGAIALTKGVLPGMLRKGKGHFVVISSIVGKFGMPLRSSYSASKHALHGFYETLRAELSNQGIKVTIICPGRINTSISLNAITHTGGKYAKMDGGQARGMAVNVLACKTIRAIRCGRKEVLIGGFELVMVYARRFFPGLYYYMVGKVKPT